MSAMVYQSQNDLLLHSLMNFFNNGENMEKMLRIVNGESRISLRIIDWFITNYSKQYYTIYEVAGKNGNERFKVYNQYKLELKSFKKDKLDIFCRHKRISIIYDKENDLSVETTIAQLNCFRWVIENRILDYIEEHFDEILEDMNTRNSSNSSVKRRKGSETIDDNNKTRKKRQELSVSAIKTLKKEYVDIVVTFE
jgi:hypothetical protein